MILQELFNKKIDFDVVDDSTRQLKTSAVINNRTIIVNCQSDSNDKWYVDFGEPSEMDSLDINMTMTGNGGEFEVLSFVKDTLLLLVQKRNPKVITFLAETDSGHDGLTRIKVYERMARKLCPSNYEYNRHTSIFGDKFTFIRKD